METSPEVIVNKEHAPRNSKELYLSLLGVDHLPVTPEDMPRGIFFPKTSFGDLGKAILQSCQDNIERSQYIAWDAKVGYKKSPIFAGNTGNTGFKEALYSLPRRYFGSKPVFTWHTHDANNWQPSVGDLARFKSDPRSAYIALIGSGVGVVALCQTQHAEKIPISSDWEYSKVLNNLKKTGFRQMEWRDMVKVINELGFAFYFWAPSSGGRVEKGSLNAGMHLWKTIV